jgi:hypothetical protein
MEQAKTKHNLALEAMGKAKLMLSQVKDRMQRDDGKVARRIG